MDLSGLKLNDPLLYIICGIIGSLSIILLLKKVESYKIKLKLLSFIGKNSLIYLGTHMSIVYFAKLIYQKNLIEPIWQKWYVYGSILTMVTVLLEILVVYIFNHWFYFLIGKSKPFNAQTQINTKE